MSAALVRAVSCLRCAGTRPEDGLCAHCGTPWPVEAAGGAGPSAGSGPADAGLEGVAAAGAGPRTLAGLIDVIVVAVLVGLAMMLWHRGTGPVFVVGLLALGVLVVVVQLAVLATRGRSLGRLCCGLRSVSGVTGSPIRPGRFLRQAGRGLHPLTADLRRGADPLEPQLTPAPLAPPSPSGSSGSSGSSRSSRSPGSSGSSGSSGSNEPSQSAEPAGGPERDEGPRPARSGLAASMNRAADWLAGAGQVGSRATASGPGQRGVPAGVYRSVAILLDSGERYDVERPLLIGRNPVDPDGRRDRVLLSWADLSRRLASTHLLLESNGPVLTVTDLHSEAGTAVIDPEGTSRSLSPGEPTEVEIGALIQMGGRTIKVVPSG